MEKKALHISNLTSPPLEGLGEAFHLSEGLGEASPPGYYHADPILYPILEEEAKRMRRFPTEAESILWEAVRRKQLGLRFRRQYVIYGYIVDFVCLPLKLIIEADGEYHFTEEQQEIDKSRHDFLVSKGFCLLRFTNQEIVIDIENIK